MMRVRHFAECAWTWLQGLCRASTAAWPALLVLIFVVLLVIGPGLGADQTREALGSYWSVDRPAAMSFARLALTLVSALLLAAALPSCIASTAKPSPQRTVLQGAAFIVPGGAVVIAASLLYAEQRDPGAGLLALSALALFAGLFIWRRTRAGLIDTGERPIRRWLMGALGVLVVAVAFFGCAGPAGVALARFIGPIGLAFLFLFVLAVLVSAMVAKGRQARFPIVTALIAAAFLFSWFNLNDNHPIAGVVGDPKPAAFGHAFAAWRAARPDAADYAEYPVIIVSAEGGGVRAAYFTGIALARMVDRCPKIAPHLFAISAVSGGSVGATVFAAAMKADPPHIADPRCEPNKSGIGPYERRIGAVVGDDHLSPLIARAFFPDFLQRFLPFAIDAFDRQRGLELSLEQSFEREFGSNLLAQTFDKMTPAAAEPAVPYLVLNTTSVESGARVAIAPFTFLGDDFNRLEAMADAEPDFIPRLSAAAGASARFPIVSPAGHVRRGIARHRYVDGGYVDNSGAETVLEMVRHLESSHGGLDRNDNPSRSAFLLVHIGNAPTCEIIEYGALQTPASRHCGRFQKNPYLAGMGEMLSPLRAVVAARGARVALTLRQWEREVTRHQERGQSYEMQRLQMYDRGLPVPLGWILSPRVRAELHVQLDARGRGGNCDSYFDTRNGCEIAFLIEALDRYRNPPP